MQYTFSISAMVKEKRELKKEENISVTNSFGHPLFYNTSILYLKFILN